MKKYGFGVDVGGTTCKIGLFDNTGVILDKWETFNDCFVLKLSKGVYLFDSPYTMEKTSEESVNVKK